MDVSPRLAPARQHELEAWFRQESAGVLRWLRAMVAINSFTANRAGVDQVSRITAQEFLPLGFSPEFIPSVNPAYGDHLALTRPGKSSRAIALITHLDTVFPPEEEARNQFRWREEGGRVYGPGVIDIKGGTAMIRLVLGGLRAFWPDAFDEIRWLVLANSSEERLSRDFSALVLDRFGPQPLAALVFEVGGRASNAWTLVTARKGRAVFRVRAAGRGAHAGSQHQRGANAALALARTIQQIEALTDYARDLTFNVGVISGGTVVNRVPHQAEAEVEMRAFTPEIFNQGKAALLALAGPSQARSAEDGFPCQIQISVEEEISPWPANPGTERLLAAWREAGRSLGQTVLAESRGGVSDGNFLWQSAPTIDGLGPHGDNSHSSELSADGAKLPEYLELDSFAPKAMLNSAAVARLIGA